MEFNDNDVKVFGKIVSIALEISGSTDGGDGYTITKCQYVDQNGQPLS